MKSQDEGMGAEEKRGKKKLLLVLSPRPGPDGPNASGWYRQLRTVLDVQHCSTITPIFSWVDNFALNYYSRARF